MTLVNLKGKKRLTISLAQTGAAISGWVFPARCVLCGNPGLERTLDFCLDCEAELPLPDSVPPHRDPAVEWMWSAFDYSFPIAGMVRALKFGGKLEFAKILGELTARRLLACGIRNLEVDRIIAVPLHVARLRARGFNQAREIAQPLCKTLRLPFDEVSVRRLRATQEQTKLDAGARRHNLQHAFVVARPVAGVRFCIVDDVATTGATVGELARMLKGAGAARIAVITVAQAAAPGARSGAAE